MFERFTERARQVVVLAQDEARLLKHKHIGTEHILMGLIREEEGLAARVLKDLGITEVKARNKIKKIVPVGKSDIGQGQIPMTPRAKKVLELALREALSLGHNYIGTEHILLGLTREQYGTGAEVLMQFGMKRKGIDGFELDGEKIRSEVIRCLSGPSGKKIKDTEKVPKKKETDKFRKVGMKILERVLDTLDELEDLVEKK